MRRIFFFLCFFFFLVPFCVFADSSKSSIVMDLDSGRVLYSHNSQQELLIASTTKIMTAILAIEHGNLNKKVTVGNEVLSMYGTNIYVEVGESMRMMDLLYGLLLRSGNDASVVIAKAVAGSEDKFVDMMNEKAKQIGMNDTIFRNPYGLDENTENYSTAYDMALLSRYAYSNKVYRKIVSTSKYEVSTGKKTYLWYNRNKLLNSYQYCTGGKNGYTPRAGKTLVTTAEKNNLHLTAVSLNDSDIYNNHKDLYERVFSKYKNYTIIDKATFCAENNLSLKNAYIKQSFHYPLTRDESDHVTTMLHLYHDDTSDKIGVIKIYLYNEEIGKVNIFSQEKKKESKSFLEWLKSLF